MKLEYIVNEDRIMVKDYLEKQNISKRLAKKIKLYGKTYVNKIEVYNYFLLSKGDNLVIEFKDEDTSSYPPVDKVIDIIYEDQYLLVINKPENLATLPTKSHFKDSLASRIKYYYQSKEIDAKVHLVNRLDYATSGLVLVAKDTYLKSLFKKTNIERKYLAILDDNLEDEGIINLPLAKKENSLLREVNEKGKQAITIYKVIDKMRKLYEFTLVTGRTHQIRIHTSFYHAPIKGDKLYGKEADRLYLACNYLKFKHPITEEELEFINYPNWY
ncbi:MAG TPA: RluA family pseudouridine synthase [Acholeplasma sp.]|nr:RluA family pseudouridine synthase [Acholeplasma sp.]